MLMCRTKLDLSPMRITKSITLALCCLLLPAAGYSQTKKSKPKPPTTVIPKTIESPLLTKQEQDLLNEINSARANPTAYIRYLEEYRNYYQGTSVKFPDGSSLTTNEGVAALNEAIAFLRTLKPLPSLVIKKGLVSASKLHLDDMLKTQKSGHTGSNGSKPEDRMNRFGTWQTSVGENIVYQARTPRIDVIGMIIDDGVATRGHRRNLFKSELKVIGISYGGPFEQHTIGVITFAGGFIDKSDSKKPTATQY